MIDWLNTIDTQVFLALNGLHAPYFDVFMKLFTGKWICVPMYAAVLFAVVRNYRWRQTLAVLVCVALAITIADQVCATLIRPEVCRLRPSNPENPLSEMCMRTRWEKRIGVRAALLHAAGRGWHGHRWRDGAWRSCSAWCPQRWRSHRTCVPSG